MSVEKLNQILGYAVRQDCSDVHLKQGRAPLFRKEGRLLMNRGLPDLSGRFFERACRELLSESHKVALEENRDVDIVHVVEELGRFRCNIYYQLGEPAMVLRHIRSDIPKLDEIGMPEVVDGIVLEPRGFILVTGTTGSGKSTTLAAMIRHINENRRCHIVTIEDPVEFVHEDAKASISQRQVGDDAVDFARALRASLRQDPDVILVGEMRDRETMETALRAAETGHLVLSTLHTLDAKESIGRIVQMFPPEQQHSIRYVLADTLKAVISQRLVRRADGKGRALAAEILVHTSRIRDLIANPERTHELKTAIEEGHQAYGSQTFDQSLLALYQGGHITLEEALRTATNSADFRLKVSGIQQ